MNPELNPEREPDERPQGPCQWGLCYSQAIGWRWSNKHQCWLPVCYGCKNYCWAEAL